MSPSKAHVPGHLKELLLRLDVGEGAGDDAASVEPVVAARVAAVKDDVGLFHAVVVNRHLDLHNPPVSCGLKTVNPPATGRVLAF